MSKYENFQGVTESGSEKIENRKSYAKLEKIEIDDKEIFFLKVSHTKETLEKFHGEINDLIKNSDIVLSERAIFNDKKRDQGDFFYKGITQMVKRNEKKMTVVEPEKDFTDALAGIAVSVMPFLASIGASAYLAEKFADLIHEKEMQNLQKGNYRDDKKVKTKISRREFLKSGFAGVIMLTGGLNGVATLLEELGIGEEKGRVLETFLLSSLDYRNAVIAREIITLTANNERISVIYGVAHAKGIKKFLNNPELLDKKIKLYQKTYGLINPVNKEVYDFSKAGNNGSYEKPSKTNYP